MGLYGSETALALGTNGDRKNPVPGSTAISVPCVFLSGIPLDSHWRESGFSAVGLGVRVLLVVQLSVGRLWVPIYFASLMSEYYPIIWIYLTIFILMR